MPAPLDLTADLAELSRLATDHQPLDALLARGLEWLARIAPYDLATVFELRGETLVVRASRGALDGQAVREHHLELARFPSIREALRTRRAHAFTEDEHTGEGDPFDGVLDLPPGHACMVVPLVAGDRALGVLTLDRTACERYAPEVVGLAEVYGQLLALALANAEQAALLERLRAQDHAHAKALEGELRGDEAGVLETSRSAAVRDVARQARQVARTDTSVLILGETGTGKERLARAIHLWSPRTDRPFVTLNCAAVPQGLLESELFGHVKGAFTGATDRRQGRFQMANGGTLMLDEIGELPLELQAKLLRVLQDGELQPVGSDRSVKVDVRIVAATHVDLPRAIAERRFREDLYYRLAVFPLVLPPLRERLDDLPELCVALLQEQARRGRSGFRVTPDGLAALRRYAWPGNVRELANVLERATILAPGRDLGPDVLDLGPRRAAAQAATPSSSPLHTLEEAQRRHIRAVLAHTGGRLYGPGGAAEILGMKPSTLQSRMKRLGMERADRGEG